MILQKKEEKTNKIKNEVLLIQVICICLQGKIMQNPNSHKLINLILKIKINSLQKIKNKKKKLI